MHSRTAGTPRRPHGGRPAPASGCNFNVITMWQRHLADPEALNPKDRINCKVRTELGAVCVQDVL